MKNLICALPLACIIACGDKEEDTAVDTAEEVEEAEEAEASEGDE